MDEDKGEMKDLDKDIMGIIFIININNYKYINFVNRIIKIIYD